MVRIRGRQLIYTRVEEEFSPNHKPGFQTVYVSPEITSVDKKSILQRVQCFQPARSNIVRRQFFSVPSGNVALTSSVQIESDPVIVDKYRREGIFLTHCLVFSREDFAKIFNNPFKIFDAFQFLESPHVMVEQFNQAEGREPECLVYADSHSPTSVDEVWQSHALKFVALSREPLFKRENNQTFLLVGSEQEIDSFLRAAFHFTLPSYRVSCSFDTCIDNCTVQPGHYWAAGASSRMHKSFIPIGISPDNFDIQDLRLTTKDPYINWLKHSLNIVHLDLINHVPTVQLLSEAMIQKSHLIIDELQEQACESFFESNRQLVIERFKDLLGGLTSNNIGELLTTYLLESGLGKGEILTIVTSPSIPPRYLSKQLCNWFQHRPNHLSQLTKTDIKVLQLLAERARDHLLLFWIAILRKDKKLRYDSLDRMNEQEYSQAIDLLFAPIKPSELVAQRYLTQLMDRIITEGKNLREQEFLELIEAVISVNGTAMIAPLADIVLYLENKSLTDLEKMVTKEPNLPHKFREAMQKRRRQVGPPASFIRRLSRRS